MTDRIRCPHCHAEFEVTEALTEHVRDDLRRDFEATLAQRLEVERQRLHQSALADARGSVTVELSDLNAQLADMHAKLTAANATELHLRKERRDVEERQRQLDLTIQRSLDEQRAQLADQVRRDADEEHRLKVADKDLQIENLRRQIEEFGRRATPVPPQTKGEVLEQDLEQLLKAHFPQDEFEPVPVGVHGGDILQHVHDDTGRDCGVILWESKRTRSWQPAWLPKLREDTRLAKARLSVIVSQELPRDLADFGCIQGIYVARRACAVGLAAVLRLAVSRIAQAERSMENRHGKADQLLAYVCGNEFHLRIAGLVEALNAMQTDLDKEKVALRNLWSKREKQIALALTCTTGFHGELEALIGADLPPEPALTLATAVA